MDEIPTRSVIIKHMHFVKSFGRFVTMSLFRLCVLILPPVIATVAIFGSASPIEKALENSGVYNNFTNAVLDQSVSENNDAQAKALLVDPGVRKAINESFSAEILQTDTEMITNGVFDWLEGKTAQPQFSIDLKEPRDKLVTNLTAYAKQRVDTLPTCTLDQIKQLQTDQNLLNLQCRPPGLDTDKAAKQFSDDILKNTDFISKQTITASDISKDETGQNFFQKQSKVPDAYHLFTISPFIIGGFGTLMAAALVLLHDKKRAGIASISWTVLGAGVFWLIGAVAYTFIFQHLNQNIPSIANAAFKQSISSLITTLANDLTRVAGMVAIIYIVLSATILITLRFTREKQIAPDYTTGPDNSPPIESKESITPDAQINEATKIEGGEK